MSTDNLIIWRIETESGVGAGHSGHAMIHYYTHLAAILRGEEKTSEASLAMDKQVGQDGLTGTIQPEHRFGCLDWDTLRLWFPSPAGCRAIAKAGGLLVAYEVPHERTKVAPLRAYFDRRFAKRVEVRPASDLHHQ